LQQSIDRPLPPTLFPYTTLFRSTACCPHRSYRLRARSFPPHSELNEKSRAERPFWGRSARLSLFPEGRQTPQNRDTPEMVRGRSDRKSTRLNSSHVSISYAVFCL